MQETSAYPHLFSPFALAGHQLKNRIVHAAILSRLASDKGMAGYLQYYLNRAAGGAAMIVTDPVGIGPHQANDRIVAWNDSMEPDLKRLAEGVAGHGCLLLGQVQDGGRGRHVPGRSYNVLGASPLPDDLSYTMPTPMSVPAIARFVELAAASSRRLQACGFAGVEVSAGHGHLFHQFLSPRSNVRDDAYGGHLEGRARLLVETCQAIRAACGDRFILGVKLPGDDGIDGSIGPAEAARIAAHLVGSVKVDYLTYAQGSHSRTLEMHLPDESAPRMAYMGLIKQLRAAAPGVPTMGLGRITDPAEAEGIVARGDSELVGLGRALITDPAWPEKARQGRARDIRYCVSCNTCWLAINSNRSLACDNNPRLARPEELPQSAAAPAAVRKHVVVVGAGIAGMEAALAAAQRGHRVTVLGRSGEVGGKARLLARLPLSESLSSIYDYQAVECAKLGVHMRLGRAAGAADVLALAPDAVVLATGASMTWPVALPQPLQAEGLVPDLRAALPPLLAVKGRQQGTAVLYDMDQTQGTYSAAEYLRDRFDRVVILCPRESVAQEVVLVMRQRILRRLHERAIEVCVQVEPVWDGELEAAGRLAFRSIYGGALRWIEDVAFFSYASPRSPDDGLLAPLRAAGVPVQLVGDCKYARDTLAATSEGYAAGCAV